MITPTEGYKFVWGIATYMERDNEEYPFLHGVLYFSSLDKLKDAFPEEDGRDIIFQEVKPESFNNWDYVPDNY